MGDQSPDFISDVVVPALERIRSRLESKGRKVAVEREDDEATIVTTHHARLELRYTLRLRREASGTYPEFETGFKDPVSDMEHRSSPRRFGPGRGGTVDEVSQNDILSSFFENYYSATGQRELF